MATLRQRKGKWQVQIRRQGSSLLSRTFTLKDDAQRWARQTEAEIDRQGSSPDPRQLTRLTLGDLLSRFRDTECSQRRGGKNEAIIVTAILRRDIARIPLSALTQEAFAKYRDWRLLSVKAGTVIRELGLVQTIIERARTDWGIALANPVKGLRKPTTDRSRDRRLKAGEWDKLLEALKRVRNPLIAPLVSFAIQTGMRRGELLNARWQDVNRANGTLYIPVTKTGEPRTIPLTPEAKQILDRQSSRRANSSDRIFPLTPEAVKLAWKRLVTRAGIEDLHFHDLRHEAVSRFFEFGLTVPEVALISGHKDPRMLFRYTHLKAEDVARKLNAPLCEPSNITPVKKRS